MIILNSALKTFIAASSITSMVAITGSIQDIQDQSLDFMENHTQITFARLDTYQQRDVASKDVSLKMLNFEKKALNQEYLKGLWTTTRYTDAQGKSEEFNNFDVELKLVANNKIVVKGEEDLPFSVLNKTPKTISLIRTLGNGNYETLELKKNFKDTFEKKVAQVEKNIATQKTELSEAAPAIQNIEYELKFAIHSNAKLEGNDVYGSLVIIDNSIESFEATLYPGSSKERSIEFTGVDLSDVGTFQVCFSNETRESFACPEEIELNSGIVIISGLINNGRVNFATGPLQGASLQFEDINKSYEEQTSAL